MLLTNVWAICLCRSDIPTADDASAGGTSSAAVAAADAAAVRVAQMAAAQPGSQQPGSVESDRATDEATHSTNTTEIHQQPDAAHPAGVPSPTTTEVAPTITSISSSDAKADTEVAPAPVVTAAASRESARVARGDFFEKLLSENAASGDANGGAKAVGTDSAMHVVSDESTSIHVPAVSAHEEGAAVQRTEGADEKHNTWRAVNTPATPFSPTASSTTFTPVTSITSSTSHTPAHVIAPAVEVPIVPQSFFVPSTSVLKDALPQFFVTTSPSVMTVYAEADVASVVVRTVLQVI